MEIKDIIIRFLRWRQNIEFKVLVRDEDVATMFLIENPQSNKESKEVDKKENKYMKYTPLKSFLSKPLNLPTGKAYYEAEIDNAEKKFVAQFLSPSVNEASKELPTTESKEYGKDKLVMFLKIQRLTKELESLRADIETWKERLRKSEEERISLSSLREGKEAVEFAEWIFDNNYKWNYYNTGYWSKRKKETKFTTQELYDLFTKGK